MRIDKILLLTAVLCTALSAGAERYDVGIVEEPVKKDISEMLKLKDLITFYVPTPVEQFLGSTKFYKAEHKCEQKLPNGNTLLYYESDVVPQSVFGATHSMEEYALNAKINYLKLVVIEGPDDTMFMGLGQVLDDDNILPVYGCINGKTPVFYNYDINLQPIPKPKNINGTWYMQRLHEFMGIRPDARYYRDNPGKGLDFTAKGGIFGDPQPMFQMRLAVEDYLTVGATNYARTEAWGYCESVPISADVNNKQGAGRGNKKGYNITGGYIIDFATNRKHPTTLSYDPTSGRLDMKFGTGTIEGEKVSWRPGDNSSHDPGLLAQYAADFEGNHDAIYARRKIHEWGIYSPVRLWDDLTLEVIALHDDFLVVKGTQKGDTYARYAVWPDKKYEGRYLDVETIADIVRNLYERSITKEQIQSNAYKRPMPEGAEESKPKVSFSQYLRNLEAKQKDYDLHAGIESAVVDYLPAFLPFLKSGYSTAYREYNQNGGPTREPYMETVMKYAKQEALAKGHSQKDIDNLLAHTVGIDKHLPLAKWSGDYKEFALANIDWAASKLTFAAMKGKKVHLVEVPFTITRKGQLEFGEKAFANPRTQEYTKLEQLLAAVKDQNLTLSEQAKSAIEQVFAKDFKNLSSTPDALEAYSAATYVPDCSSPRPKHKSNAEYYADAVELYKNGHFNDAQDIAYFLMDKKYAPGYYMAGLIGVNICGEDFDSQNAGLSRMGKAAELGIPEAQIFIAKYYAAQGSFTPVSLEYLDMAMAQDFVPAYSLKAKHLMDNQEYDEAIDLLKKGVAKGAIECNLNLGRIYEHIADERNDPQKALECYLTAYNAGFLEACDDLARIYSNKELSFYDPATAVRYAKEGIIKNHSATASFYMGYFYYHGIGVKRNTTQAAMLYAQAAKDGETEATADLALMQFNGQGIDMLERRALFQAERGFTQKNSPRIIGIHGAIKDELELGALRM